MGAILSRLSATLKTYKVYFILTLGLLYSVALWHVATKYTNAGWQAEKIQLVEKALETTAQRQELAQMIGTQLESKLGAMSATQTTIHQKVIRETIKEPVYRDCITTPDGVRLIEQAIDNR